MWTTEPIIDKRPRALDLFCGAGGASMGLHRAGFNVTGVDLVFQPCYPFSFVQCDAMQFALDGFDFIWASPPCQHYSITKSLHANYHPDLIAPVRDRLRLAGTKWVIENVPGAPLINPIVLCGTMFNLRVYRHRLFESNFAISVPMHYAHSHGSTGSHRGYSRGNPMVCVAGRNFERTEGALAMGIDWMTSRAQLSQAIPPVYAEYIGRYALAAMRAPAW